MSLGRCRKDHGSYLVPDESSGVIFFPFFFFFISSATPHTRLAALNPTLNTERVSTAPALLALLLCNVAWTDLDNV